MTNDVVSSFAVADPVNWSEDIPNIGSSVKLMAIEACGLTKKARIWVRSASPSIVTDIDVLALGASSMMRIQLPSVLAAEIRVEVAMTPAWLCGAP